MHVIRAVLIKFLTTALIVISSTIMLGAPMALFAQETDQKLGGEVPRTHGTSSREPPHAASRALLGKAHLGFNLSYIRFSDDVADTSSTESGSYVGVLAYGLLAHGLYIGGEVGKAQNLRLFSGNDVEFLPMELNLKYVYQASSHLILDLGGGLSYSYVDIDEGKEWNLGCIINVCPAAELPRANADEVGDDWLLGGQVFTELMFRTGWLSLGFNGKYQITEDFKNSGFALNNWRVGMVTAIVF